MNYSDVTADDIILTKLYFNDKQNHYQLKILSNDDKLEFKTPKMKLNEVNNSYITLEFLKNNNKFYDFMFELNNHIVQEIYKNSQSLFDIDLTLDNVKNLFVGNIDLPPNLSCHPVIKLNVSNSCQVYDKDDSLIELLDLENNCEVECIISAKKIIFKKNRFYIDYKVKSISIKNYVHNCTSYMLSEICPYSDDEYNVIYSDNT